jgi:hypothetical protein
MTEEPRYTEAEWKAWRLELRCASELHRPTAVQSGPGYTPTQGFCECGAYKWTAERRDAR